MNNQRCRAIYCPYCKKGFCGFDGVISINEQGLCSIIVKVSNKNKIKKNLKFSFCEVTDVVEETKENE